MDLEISIAKITTTGRHHGQWILQPLGQLHDTTWSSGILITPVGSMMSGDVGAHGICGHIFMKIQNLRMERKLIMKFPCLSSKSGYHLHATVNEKLTIWKIMT